MRTCIKAWMSLNLGQIPLLTMELAALEHLKNRRRHFFSVAIDPILFKLRSVRVAERLALPTSDHGVAGLNPAGGEILPEPKQCFIAQSLSCSPFHRLEMTEILLKGRKTLTHPSIHLFKLAGNEDMHNILDEFEFRPDVTTDYGVSCPWASEKIRIDL